MWEADKIIYKDEGDFIAAYIGENLMWKITSENGIKIYIKSIEDGTTPNWNGQTLTLGWNTLDLTSLEYTYFYPHLSSIKNAVIGEVSFDGFSYDKLERITNFLWNDSMRRFIDVDKLSLVNCDLTNITTLMFSTSNTTNEVLNIGTIEGNLYLPNCTSLSNCFYNLQCPNFNLSVIEAPTLRNCQYMFANAQIEKAPQIIGSNIAIITNMFDGSSVKEIPIMDCTNVTSTTSSFRNCTELTTVGGFIGLKIGISFNKSPLTLESVKNIANTIGEGSGSAIGFSQYTDNLLTDELRALFTNKGWVITA